MSTLSQFGGNRPARSITSVFSTSGYAGVPLFSSMARSLASGALTANTLKTIFSATGGGVIHTLFAITTNGTSRTIRMRLTLDGVVVFDSTSAAIATGARGGSITGGVAGSEAFPAVPLTFNSSATFEIASSLTETDTITTSYILEGK